jgi:hypothetical protein
MSQNRNTIPHIRDNMATKPCSRDTDSKQGTTPRSRKSFHGKGTLFRHRECNTARDTIRQQGHSTMHHGSSSTVRTQHNAAKILQHNQDTATQHEPGDTAITKYTAGTLRDNRNTKAMTAGTLSINRNTL